MNIFYLDNNQSICAKYHVDKHVVKMILEYAQLLSTAHRVLDDQQLDPDMGLSIYKLTHKNHPSTIWVRKSASNYRWLYEMWISLMDEYTYRYGKQHASGRLIDYLVNLPKNISTVGVFTEPTPAMPEEYMVPADSIQSYRNYYIKDKIHLHNWKQREVPSFIDADQMTSVN